MKETIRKIARRCGYDITRYAPDTNHAARLASCLKRQGIETIVDVGANVGQFASATRQSGFRGRLISIEPQKDAHDTLGRCAERDPLGTWHVVPRMAVGESEGTLDLHIAGNSYSTSVLPMLRSHEQAMPSSREVRVERIGVNRLDTVINGIAAHAVPPFMIKLDVQGFESVVLRGATGILPQTRAILTEMSLVPLYEGQILWRDLADQIAGYGFELFDLIPGFADPDTGRLLQCDGLFVSVP
jgi:FkbM family methyltransferase